MNVQRIVQHASNGPRTIRGTARTGPRTRAWNRPKNPARKPRPGRARGAAGRAGNTAPASAPACARGCRTPAWRTPPPRPAARTGSAPRPPGKTSAGRRCRCTSVDTSAGSAICCAPSRMAVVMSLPISRLRSMFSISTVASSTRMPTASARPPRVMMLIVSPSALSMQIALRIESGMENADDQRVPPVAQEKQDHRGRQHAAMAASVSTPLTGRLHEDRLVEKRLDGQFRRQRGEQLRQPGADGVDDVERGGSRPSCRRSAARRAGRPGGRCSSAG